MTSPVSPYSTTELSIIFGFTVCIIVVELILLISMAPRIMKLRKESGPSSIGFMNTTFILILAIFISRIIFSIFDFIETQYDINFYAQPIINNWTWKIGIVISGLGYIYMIYFLDKQILHFKFKGIFAYIYLAGLVFAIAYPISTYTDFQLVSSVTVYTGLGFAIIPLAFLYIAIKSTGDVRKTALLIFLSIVFIAVSGLLVNANFIGPLIIAYGGSVIFPIYLVFAAGTSLGLILLVIGARKFQI